MRVLFAVLLGVATVLPATGQGKKELPLHQKIAREGVRIGDVFIAGTGKEGRVTRGEATIATLTVTLQLVAAVEDRRFGFTFWDKEGTVRLTDDLDNVYLHFPQQSSSNIAVTTLYSDLPVTTFLWFDRPVPKAKALTLELSAKNIDYRQPGQPRKDVPASTFKLTLERGKNAGEWVLVKPSAVPAKKKP